MATVTPTSVYNGDGTTTITWSGIVTGDTVNSYEIAGAPADVLAYVSGTFAGGTTVSFSGSNDDTNFATDLVDPSNTAISLTAAGAAPLRDAWRYIKPAVASGAADSITVTLLVRSA